jgi:prevent-host-death family protein
MAEIGIKELKARASQVIEEVGGGASYVVTNRGRPAAVIVPIDEAEDIVLANADEFIRMRRQSRAAYRRRRTTNLDELP